ncbi:HNH endonuclease [Nocardioides sp. YR527]|uniref:HNH endonuclease signature motif containing protein n=1 Tax=Nocardioides sp. YR527 TaxID=1881028 RepID=UPI000891216D|nr:HNH endonuclease signature motif containing protein [Nocardioides sp. YR527]SDK86826.1 HNH endonuclease [Nocardioides sp. YR527]
MSLGREIDHWGTNPGDAIDAALNAIESALHELLATDPAYWRTGQKKDLLERLEKLQAQQAALKLRVLASAGDIAEETGAKDASGWMRTELLVDKAVARSQMKLAAGVAKYDLVAAGLAEGVVSQDKARVITQALDAIEADPAASAEDLILAEKLLVDYAGRLTANELRIVGKRILAEIDPERFEAAEAKALQREEEHAQRRTFYSSRDNGDGTIDIHARVSRAVGLRLRTLLDSLAQPRKLSAEDKGRKVPYDQLLGQAFARVIETYDVDQLPRHGGHGTTVFITMSLDQLRADLGTAALGFDGEQITAAEARRMACNADLVPVVLGTDSEILDLGRTARLAYPVQHRALRLRDKCCQAEDCDAPAAWTEAHHLKPWSEDGKTDLANMVLLCPSDHRRIHDPDYTYERLPDGRIRFTRRALTG